MPGDVEATLVAEIKQLLLDEDAARHAIKRNLSQGKSVEEAERHHRECRARLALLQDNLKKMRASPAL
jgi:hypothetical protein